MAEYTAVALQTVAAGADIAFTETAVNGSGCITHREGSGIVKLEVSLISAVRDSL